MLIEKFSAPLTLNSIVDDFLVWSRCATEQKEKDYLKQILGNHHFVVAFLLFSGSYHGCTL